MNVFSVFFGDGSESQKKSVKLKTPQTLRSLVQSYLQRSCPKSILNAIYAQQIFQSHFTVWNTDSPFAETVKVGSTNDPEYWYAQPEWLTETQSFLFNMLDVTHLFSNARCTCCSKGIEAAGISKTAWLEVSKHEKDNKTGLNLAMVKDLIDRQSNAFARTTFSEKVEKEMIRLGFVREANFCALIRNWYEAEDEPGLSATERHERRMNLRKWMLEKYNPFQFPPPAAHISGIPIVMFEGIMGNIDRRIQLYAMCEKGTYSVRSIGSLDSENFFGEFQSLDPKGSGVVRADDIPSTMETAVELLQARMNENRYVRPSQSCNISDTVFIHVRDVDEHQSGILLLMFNNYYLVLTTEIFFNEDIKHEIIHEKRLSKYTKKRLTVKVLMRISLRNGGQCGESEVISCVFILFCMI